MGPVGLKIGGVWPFFFFGPLASVDLAAWGFYLRAKGAKPLDIFWSFSPHQRNIYFEKMYPCMIRKKPFI